MYYINIKKYWISIQIFNDKTDFNNFNKLIFHIQNILDSNDHINLSKLYKYISLMDRKNKKDIYKYIYESDIYKNLIELNNFDSKIFIDNYIKRFDAEMLLEKHNVMCNKFINFNINKKTNILSFLKPIKNINELYPMYFNFESLFKKYYNDNITTISERNIDKVFDDYINGINKWVSSFDDYNFDINNMDGIRIEIYGHDYLCNFLQLMEIYYDENYEYKIFSNYFNNKSLDDNSYYEKLLKLSDFNHKKFIDEYIELYSLSELITTTKYLSKKLSSKFKIKNINDIILYYKFIEIKLIKKIIDAKNIDRELQKTIYII